MISIEQRLAHLELQVGELQAAQALRTLLGRRTYDWEFVQNGDEWRIAALPAGDHPPTSPWAVSTSLSCTKPST